MSIIRSTQYPGRWNVPDSNSPQGSGKNRTSPTSNDGSYFDETWFNDMDSLHQALFIASGITPNGTQDIGTASQIFDALLNNRWSTIGNYSVGTIVTASNGKQYYCKQANGRDTAVVDPSSVSDRNTWVEFPYESGINSNGTYKIHYDDSIEQWGSSSTGNGTVIQSYPIPFKSTVTHVGPGYVSNPSGGVEYVQVVSKSNLESFSAVGYVDIATGPAVGNVEFTFYAKGF